MGKIVRDIQESVCYRADLQESSLPLGLRSVGHAIFGPNQATPARTIDFVQILWTVRGEGCVRVGAKALPAKPGWVATCFPDSPHQLSTRGSEWEYRWFTVDGTCALPILNGLQIGRMPFHAGPCSVERFNRLSEALKQVAVARELDAGAELYAMLTDLAKACRTSGRQVPNDLLHQVLKRVTTSIGDPALGVDVLARGLGLSRFSLHRLFTRELGMSPKRYIDNLRLQKALSLLKESDLPISEIAAQTGFASANYFAKFIQKRVQLPPSEVRQKGLL